MTILLGHVTIQLGHVTIQLDYLTRSHDYPTRSCDYPTRSCDYPTRSCDYPTRSCDYPTRSGDYPTRSCDLNYRSLTFAHVPVVEEPSYPLATPLTKPTPYWDVAGLSHELMSRQIFTRASCQLVLHNIYAFLGSTQLDYSHTHFHNKLHPYSPCIGPTHFFIINHTHFLLLLLLEAL